MCISSGAAPTGNPESMHSPRSTRRLHEQASQLIEEIRKLGPRQQEIKREAEASDLHGRELEKQRFSLKMRDKKIALDRKLLMADEHQLKQQGEALDAEGASLDRHSRAAVERFNEKVKVHNTSLATLKQRMATHNQAARQLKEHLQAHYTAVEALDRKQADLKGKQEQLGLKHVQRRAEAGAIKRETLILDARRSALAPEKQASRRPGRIGTAHRWL